MVQEQSIL